MFVAKYRAVRACFHRANLYRAGDIYEPTTEEVRTNTIPEHFIKEKEFTPDLVKTAEEEDRSRVVFVKPNKAPEIPIKEASAAK
jgi:hypothetical protein